MNLKVLLPYKVFIKAKGVKKIIAETRDGSYGLLPARLDCVAALVPGIFEYLDADNNTVYFAADEGILIKAGNEVLVSVRNAVAGSDLNELRVAVRKQFVQLDEDEKEFRTVTTKLSTTFISSLDKFYND